MVAAGADEKESGSGEREIAALIKECFPISAGICL